MLMLMTLWRRAEHEELTEAHWDEGAAIAAIARIVADAESAEADGLWPGHPRDALGVHEQRLRSLYLGSAGMIWGLWQLGSSLDAVQAIGEAVRSYRQRPDFGPQAHPPSLWNGEAGLLTVAQAVGSPAADLDRLTELVRSNAEHPTWELMWGSPGTMLAAWACGLRDVGEESAQFLLDAWDEASDLWTQDLYGTVTQYLGPAHGFAGNVHALRAYLSQEELSDRVSRLLERTALREDALVNWPPALDEPRSKIRLQWCHGAPGIISTLGDLIPRELALAGGELTWRAGPLRKGPGLCHGTAGNGFALLRLHQLTGDERWLRRARRFARHAIDQVERARTEFGRGRYTLWTGDIGVALYLRACLESDARFPTLDYF